jgi:aspartyl/glutamyl-tRNA(Asn/Gln) amidotransferase C subunit
MAHISHEELLHIADLSALRIAPEEEASFCSQIDTILAYVDQITSIQEDGSGERVCNVNVLHDDVPQQFDSKLLLERSPNHDSAFFVVPKILDEK